MCEEMLQRSTFCEDIRAVVSLPNELQDGGYSQTLDNYVQRKRQQHEEIFERMGEELGQLNKRGDQEVGQCIEMVRQELEWMKNETEKNYFGNVKSVEQWILVSEKTTKQKSQISTIMDELSEELKSIEQSRGENIKIVLLKFKEEAVKLRFVSIEIIEKTFQDKIVDINRNTLMNYETNEDFKFNLYIYGQQIVDESRKFLKEKAQLIAKDEAQRLWGKIKAKQYHDLVAETLVDLTQENENVRKECLQANNRVEEKLSEFKEKVLELPNAYDSAGDFWRDWTERKVDTFNTVCKIVNELINNTITSTVISIVKQIQTLTTTLQQKLEKSQPEKESFDQLSDNLETAKKNHYKELRNLQINWQEGYDRLGKTIDRNKIFLLDLKSIWINHLERVSKVLKILEDAFQSSHNTCAKRDKEKSGKVKIQIKAIREANDLNKLKSSSEALEKIFNELRDNWQDIFESQLQKIEEVQSTNVEKLIEGMLFDINQVMNVKCPKHDGFAAVSSSATNEILNESNRDQIDKCIREVDRKVNEMYSDLERFVFECEATVDLEFEVWLYSYVQDIIRKYHTQMDVMDETNAKTVQDIVDERTAELIVHSQRLISHTFGVKDVLAELSQQYEGVKSKQKALIVAFHDKLSKSKENKPTGSCREIKNIIMEMEQDWAVMTGEIESSVSEAKTHCEIKFDKLKQCNEAFSKTAKAFKNGGNYSPEELKTLNKELKLLENRFTGQRKTLLNNYNALVKGVSRQVLDSRMDELQQKLNEITLLEEIEDCLNTTRTCLRREVDFMKTTGDVFGGKLTHLNSLTGTDASLVNDVLELSRLRNEYMVFPEGVSSLENIVNGRESAVSRKANTSERNNTKSVLNRSSLFNNTTDSVLNQQNNFFARTKGLLLKKYNILIEAVRDTFKVKPTTTGGSGKTSSSKKKETKPDVKTNLISEHTEKLRFIFLLYNKECELAWIQQLRVFLDQMESLKTSINSQIQHELENIHQIYINSLATLERQYWRTIERELREGANKREKLRETLVLPLAHPTHQHKLETFLEKATKLSETQNENYNNIVTTYKYNLQYKHDNYVQQIKTLIDKLSLLQSTVFDESFCRIFSEILQSVPTNIPNQSIVEEVNEENTADTDKPTYTLSIWSDEEDSSYAIQKSTSSVFEKESISMSQIYRGEEVEKVAINRIATKQVKESAEQIQKLYDEAKLARMDNEKISASWINSLEYDIQQAKLVFKPLCN